MHSFKTKKVFLKSIFRNSCHYCPFREPHSVQYWWDHSFSLGFCSITAICGTPRKRLVFAQHPVLAASVGLKLVPCRGKHAACMSILSISSHQAVSKALGLNINSSQIDWKGVICFGLWSISLCVSVLHSPVITTAKCFTTSSGSPLNEDLDDTNGLTCNRSKTELL